VDMPSQIKKKD